MVFGVPGFQGVWAPGFQGHLRVQDVQGRLGVQDAWLQLVATSYNQLQLPHSGPICCPPPLTNLLVQKQKTQILYISKKVSNKTQILLDKNTKNTKNHKITKLSNKICWTKHKFCVFCWTIPARWTNFVGQKTQKTQISWKLSNKKYKTQNLCFCPLEFVQECPTNNKTHFFSKGIE